MKNDDVIKRYRSLFTSKEESNKTEGGAPFTDYWKTKEIEEFWLAEIKRAREEAITGETSDGYHTFNELYEFRLLYNAALFNEWSLQNKYNVHKSKKHFDGEDCFGGGWFIVMANLPTGQISNHYELKDWDLFKCDEREKAEEWDGHTAKDVSKRLLQALKEEL